MMSPEWVAAASSFATFVVIAASAVAALVQLRHMRNSNQMVALNELRETMESAAFLAAYREIRGPFQVRLAEPEFRHKVLSERSLSSLEAFQPAILIGNFYENAGGLVKHGIIDPEIFCDLWGATVEGAWESLQELIVNRRLIVGVGLYENFEYLVILARRHVAKYPNGSFPSNMQRIATPEPWAEAKELHLRHP